jgi:hypothetical protein
MFAGKDKHSSLLQKSVNYGQKKFYDFGCVSLKVAALEDGRAMRKK